MLDMELAELDIRMRKIFSNSFELGFDIPFLSFHSGFMDSDLEGFHRTFGLADYGREARPLDSFLYRVKRDGVTIIEGEDGRAGISDIRLSAKKALMTSDTSVSLKFDVELPTGDPKKGFGNGNPGADISLLVDKAFGERFMAYGSLGVAFPGDLKGHQTVEMRQFMFGGAALEMAVDKKLSLVGQLTFQESPYPETGIDSVDVTAIMLTLGGRYAEGKSSYEFAFTEDPNTAGVPDFIIGLSYKKTF